MTTIAFDGKTLVGDGLEVQDSTAITFNCKKIYRIPNGWYSAAGDATDCHVVGAWLMAGGNADERPIVKKGKTGDGFDPLIVTDDGDVFTFNRDLTVMIPGEIPYAIGSGWLIAYAGMKAGMTAKRAVELACELDINTGGTLQIVKVKK